MGIWGYVCMTLLMILGIFMILIILLQRGRGGGLAGAFGGLGGQSAFGTKAGDVFTKITICFAVAWTVLAGVSGILLRGSIDQLYPNPKASAVKSEEGADPPTLNAPAVKSEEKKDDTGGRAEEKEAPDRDLNNSDSSADSGDEGKGSSEKSDSSDSKGTDK